MKDQILLRVSALAAGLVFFGGFSGSFLQERGATIRLVPDPEFGAEVDWGYYFKAAIDQPIGFLQDGTFYAASMSRNKVLAFDPTGKLRFEFGRPG